MVPSTLSLSISGLPVITDEPDCWSHHVSPWAKAVLPSRLHGGPFPSCLDDHHMDGMKDQRNGCVFVPNGLGGDRWLRAERGAALWARLRSVKPAHMAFISAAWRLGCT